MCWGGFDHLFLYSPNRFSKELGITVLGVLVAFEIFHVVDRGVYSPGRGVHKEALEALLRVVVIVSNGVFYLFLRRHLVGEVLSVGHDVFRSLENPVAFMPPGLPRILSIGWIQLYYGYLLVAPVEMSCDYSASCITLVQAPEDPRVILIWAAAAVFSLFCLRAAWDGLARRDFRLGSALAWLVLPYLPSSHIFINIGTLVAERLLYIPSIGYCLLVAYFFDLLFGDASVVDAKPPAPQPTPASQAAGGQREKRSSSSFSPLLLLSLQMIFLGALVPFYLHYLHARNEEWFSDIALFTAALRVCPGSAKVQQNTGVMDRTAGRADMAIQKFLLAREIHPEYCETDLQLALTYANINLTTTLLYLRKSIYCKFTELEAGKTIFSVAEQLGVPRGEIVSPLLQLILGEVYAKIDTEETRKMALTHYRIAGNAFVKLQPPDFDQGLEALMAAYSLDADKNSCEYERLLADLFAMKGENRRAVLHFRRALKCGVPMKDIVGSYIKCLHVVLAEDVDDPMRQFEWAEAIAVFGDVPQSQRHYLAAGKMFLSSQNPWDAQKAAERALKVDPDYCEALDLQLQCSIRVGEDGKAKSLAEKMISHPVCSRVAVTANNLLKGKKKRAGPQGVNNE